jgi:hypothetical protein
MLQRRLTSAIEENFATARFAARYRYHFTEKALASARGEYLMNLEDTGDGELHAGVRRDRADHFRHLDAPELRHLHADATGRGLRADRHDVRHRDPDQLLTIHKPATISCRRPVVGVAYSPRMLRALLCVLLGLAAPRPAVLASRADGE